MKIGFIGLGSQGAPIARRIARCGFSLVACDINTNALSAFNEPNVILESDPIATATQVDVQAPGMPALPVRHAPRTIRTTITTTLAHSP